MKKQIVLLVSAALVAGATFAVAKDIKGSSHDLTVLNYGGTKSAEICIYCHTPHNPVQAIPLWNRTNPSAGGFSFYKSGTTTAITNAAQMNTGSVSLFCMSCHDGVTALGAITNKGLNSTGMDTVTPISAANNDKIGEGVTGKDLTRSHPIAFDYDLAQKQDTKGLRPIADATSRLMGGSTETGGSRPFFGNSLSTTGNFIECASCHMVHNDDYGKFLRISNTGSELCLACHSK